MPTGVYIRTKEHREKLRLAKLGDKNPSKRPEVAKKISIGNTGKIRTEEQKKRSSESRKGKKQSSETIEKRRLKLIGRKILWKDKIGKSNKGKKRSKETIEKHKQQIIKLWQDPEYRKNHSGKNSHMWKGGITKLQDLIRELKKYKQWRSQIFQRDNWTCQTCHFRGNVIAHHIKQFSTIIEQYNIKTLDEALNCSELWNINNGVTLCEDCHNLTKKGRNKNICA